MIILRNLEDIVLILEYLKMKDYACWNMVGDDFFNGDKWLVRMADMFKVAKPMMDFMNSVIDDYE